MLLMTRFDQELLQTFLERFLREARTDLITEERCFLADCEDYDPNRKFHWWLYHSAIAYLPEGPTIHATLCAYLTEDDVDQALAIIVERIRDCQMASIVKEKAHVRTK